ncbi:glycerol-3-phosphate dehydrogenase [Hyphomonas johnsonii]|uniref:Glycerol-3-phosphate dehydrogenase n=1 Tax=Hyphomonas johnsonii MHS-2 TaxID=1280950 RepID=A0A059FMF8_9PROT|nr:glycerol-3-phosphate dehydrogenase [Hyphomonas johnsonii]KCZ91711.1 glycerol-3-phosphate dehydrogenase [Hyphomonas johnsonii MHS-2]
MHDLLVIGGGINGVGIARDAAGRGLKVVLCEKDDLAAHTSSASTKLIHGGLRYLEQYDFALVRKALIEREILLRAAPHIIWPMRFVLPYDKDLRPAWLIRLGLFLYDHLGGRKMLPPTKTLRRGKTDRLDPLKAEFRLAFEYSDCWVEDARLVVLNAVDAQTRGADIRTRTACTGLVRHADHWEATLKGPDGERTVMARAVVNAAGGWVDAVLGLAEPGRTQKHLRLVKGSHIIVPRWHEGDHAYFFQNGDGRIMFAIPYERGEFTLIGTTDVPFEADKDNVVISQDEIDYLCAGASEYYKRAITPADVVATYSGVRPLYDDRAANASKVTRDYVLNCDRTGGAPVLSVFGGKITTFRELAEHALKELAGDFPGMGPAWTRDASLPGGDIPRADFEDFLTGLAQRYDWMAPDLLRRLARAYGTRVPEVLGDATDVSGLGHDFGAGLYAAEVAYLIANEFAVTAEDVLWRRSKMRLHLTAAQQEALAAWMEQNGQDRGATGAT